MIIDAFSHDSDTLKSIDYANLFHCLIHRKLFLRGTVSKLRTLHYPRFYVEMDAFMYCMQLYWAFCKFVPS